MARNTKKSTLHLVPSDGDTQDAISSRSAATRTRRSDASDYYDRIKVYAQKIRDTSNVNEIISILEEALKQTRALHTDDELAIARQEVTIAEQHIEQLKTELELVSNLVREDQLTGALNRRGLDNALAIAELSNTPWCIAVIDIDNFKTANDTFGHQFGDAVMLHLVDIVKKTMRTNDLIGRYGGDEFLLLLSDSNINEAAAVMTRLKRELTEKPFSWENQQWTVRFSAGVAEHQPHESSMTLIRRADEALYQAKRNGKDQIITT